jgi:uncharacterized protein (TIGR01777 family)
MNPTHVEFESELPVSAETAFDWHARDGAFQRLTPPWSGAELLERKGGLEPGARTTIRMPVVGPLAGTWVAEHGAMSKGREFSDHQVSGPFAQWEHVHRFEPVDSGRCILRDSIRYRLPLGALGAAVGGPMARSEIARAFGYRHRTTLEDLRMHARYQGKVCSVAMTGSTGMVGGSLAQVLSTGGYPLRHFGRSKPEFGDDFVSWNPAEEPLPADTFEGIEAVVHLAGENISEGRWTAEKKRRLRDSRIESTRAIAENLAKLPKRPKVFVCASAIGYYGNRGDELLNEDSAPGDDFLAELCRDWEAACQPARDAGIRVVNLRIGVVLSARGGALAKMLLPFRLGLGGVVGSGTQYMSWVALDDLVGIIVHAVHDENLSGPVNAVAPNPVTNREYTKTLGRVLSRPTIVPLPAFAAKLAFGEMADALLLSSTRVEPSKLLAEGYAYRTPTLEEALSVTLGRA